MKVRKGTGLKIALIAVSILFVISLFVNLYLYTRQYGGITPDRGFGPPITLSFDDGPLDQYTNAFPLLSERGMVGTFYVISDCIEKSGLMTATQLLELQKAGNEIGSHSRTHPDFTTLTEEQIRNECFLSKKPLEELGLRVSNFRYPYATSNEWVDSIVDDYYQSGCYGGGYMEFPITTWHINAMGAWNCNLTTLKSFVDYAFTHNKWININFHTVREGYGTGNENIETADFIALLDYIRDRGFITVTVQQMLRASQK